MARENEDIQRKLRAMFEDAGCTQYAAGELRRVAVAAEAAPSGTVPEGGMVGGGASAGVGDARTEGAAGEGRVAGALDLSAVRVLCSRDLFPHPNRSSTLSFRAIAPSWLSLVPLAEPSTVLSGS